MVSNPIKTGVLGGSLLSVFASVQLEDLFKTVILATVGVTVSVSVSFVLRYFQQRFLRVKS